MSGTLCCHQLMTSMGCSTFLVPCFIFEREYVLIKSLRLSLEVIELTLLGMDFPRIPGLDSPPMMCSCLDWAQRSRFFIADASRDDVSRCLA